jgi:hypothetical protein
LYGLHILSFIDCKNGDLPSHVFQVVGFLVPVIYGILVIQDVAEKPDGFQNEIIQ